MGTNGNMDIIATPSSSGTITLGAGETFLHYGAFQVRKTPHMACWLQPTRSAYYSIGLIDAVCSGGAFTD